MTYRPFFALLLLLMVSACATETGEQSRSTRVTVPTSMEMTDKGIAKTDDARYTNARYQFSVSYPEGWTVEESENSDGATFFHPENEAVYLSVSGSQPLAEVLPGEAELENWASERLLYDDFKLIKDEVVTFQNDVLTPKGYEVDGRAGTLQAESAVFQYEEDDLDLDLEVRQYKVLADDRTVTVYLEAPRHLSTSFAPVFDRVIASLVLD